MIGSQQRRQEAGGLKDKKEESRAKCIRGFSTSLNWKVSWPKNDSGISLEKRCCGTEEGCPRKSVTSDVIREYKAVHEVSSRLREEERERRKNIGDRRGEQRREGQNRGEEMSRKKRTKRGVFKEGLSVLFLWRLLISSVREEIWRVVVVFLGETFWISLGTCLIVSLRFGWR